MPRMMTDPEEQVKAADEKVRAEWETERQWCLEEKLLVIVKDL